MATLTANTAMKERLARALPPAPKSLCGGAGRTNSIDPCQSTPGHKTRTPARSTAVPGKARTKPAELAQRERQERQSVLYERLRQLSPILFAGAPVPMACGIRPEIIKRLELDDARDLAALAILRRLVSQSGYQSALAAEGAVRLNLAGEIVEPVSDAHGRRRRALLSS